MNYLDANDTIKSLFLVAWRAGAPPLNDGTLPPIEWPGIDSGTPPPSDAPWARISVRHNRSNQATFGKAGERLFRRLGLIDVQVFAPVIGRGLLQAQELAIIARDAFEGIGTPTGLEFRNSRIQEVGVNKGLVQINVSIEFEYTEQR